MTDSIAHLLKLKNHDWKKDETPWLDYGRLKNRECTCASPFLVQHQKIPPSPIPDPNFVHNVFLYKKRNNQVFKNKCFHGVQFHGVSSHGDECDSRRWRCFFEYCTYLEGGQYPKTYSWTDLQDIVTRHTGKNAPRPTEGSLYEYLLAALHIVCPSHDLQHGPTGFQPDKLKDVKKPRYHQPSDQPTASFRPVSPSLGESSEDTPLLKGTQPHHYDTSKTALFSSLDPEQFATQLPKGARQSADGLLILDNSVWHMVSVLVYSILTRFIDDGGNFLAASLGEREYPPADNSLFINHSDPVLESYCTSGNPSPLIQFDDTNVLKFVARSVLNLVKHCRELYKLTEGTFWALRILDRCLAHSRLRGILCNDDLMGHPKACGTTVLIELSRFLEIAVTYPPDSNVSMEMLLLCCFRVVPHPGVCIGLGIPFVTLYNRLLWYGAPPLQYEIAQLKEEYKPQYRRLEYASRFLAVVLMLSAADVRKKAAEWKAAKTDAAKLKAENAINHLKETLTLLRITRPDFDAPSPKTSSLLAVYTYHADKYRFFDHWKEKEYQFYKEYSKWNGEDHFQSQSFNSSTLSSPSLPSSTGSSKRLWNRVAESVEHDEYSGTVYLMRDMYSNTSETDLMKLYCEPRLNCSGQKTPTRADIERSVEHRYGQTGKRCLVAAMWRLIWVVHQYGQDVLYEVDYRAEFKDLFSVTSMVTAVDQEPTSCSGSNGNGATDDNAKGDDPFTSTASMDSHADADHVVHAMKKHQRQSKKNVDELIRNCPDNHDQMGLVSQWELSHCEHALRNPPEFLRTVEFKYGAQTYWSVFTTNQPQFNPHEEMMAKQEYLDYGRVVKSYKEAVIGTLNVRTEATMAADFIMKSLLVIFTMYTQREYAQLKSSFLRWFLISVDAFGHLTASIAVTCNVVLLFSPDGVGSDQPYLTLGLLIMHLVVHCCWFLGIAFMDLVPLYCYNSKLLLLKSTTEATRHVKKYRHIKATVVYHFIVTSILSGVIINTAGPEIALDAPTGSYAPIWIGITIGLVSAIAEFMYFSQNKFNGRMNHIFSSLPIQPLSWHLVYLLVGILSLWQPPVMCLTLILLGLRTKSIQLCALPFYHKSREVLTLLLFNVTLVFMTVLMLFHWANGNIFFPEFETFLRWTTLTESFIGFFQRGITDAFFFSPEWFYSNTQLEQLGLATIVLVYSIAIPGVFGALLTGLITDEFGRIRDAEAERREALASRCVICGVTAGELNAVESDGFAKHVKDVHHSWDYIHFLDTLLSPKHLDRSPLDSLIKSCYPDLPLAFLPLSSKKYTDPIRPRMRRDHRKSSPTVADL